MAGETDLDEDGTNVFISYSRRDGAAADRLHAKLGARGLNPYLDKHDIAAGEDWHTRLGALIESADVVVFLISPDSVASEICAWEAEHAEQLGKRILPVLIRPTEDGAVPARLRRLNYVFMRDGAEEDASLPVLASAIETDIGWVRNHTRYGELAVEWERAGRPSRLLLRGASIGEAERWRDAHPPTAPQLTETQSAFIAVSRAAATGRQRLAIAGSLAVAIVAIGLSVFALFQRNAAEQSRQETQATLAASDFRQGSELVIDDETTPQGMAFLARAARAGDGRAAVRLWTLLQQREFWIPVAEEPIAVSQGADTGDAAAPAIPEDVARRFATVHILGETVVPENLSLSGDGSRLVLTAQISSELRVGDRVYVRVFDVDGTPVSEWLSPYIIYPGLLDPYMDLTGNHISAAWGHLSFKGRYLVVEAENRNGGPRYLVPFDLEGGTRKVDLNEPLALSDDEPPAAVQLGGRIDASIGSNDENATFTVLRFKPGSQQGGESVADLLIGTSAGIALHEELSSVRVLEVSRHVHKAALTAVEFDRRYFISAASDLTVTATRQFATDAQPVRTASPVERVSIAKRESVKLPEEMTIDLASGLRQTFHLSKRKQSVFDVSPTASAGLDATSCYRPGDATPLQAGPGMSIGLAGPRVVESVRENARSLSPPLPADIVLICVTPTLGLAAITTADFRTSVWQSDFSARLGTAFDESQQVKGVTRPIAADTVSLGIDGRALTGSTIAGKGNRHAFTVWDIASGVALTDRYVTAFAAAEADTTAVSARFDSRGDLAVVNRKGQESPEISLNVPAALASLLPDYAEAIAGLTIGESGAPEAVSGRVERVKAWAEATASLGQTAPEP